jgi:serine phosphatase RsbU (regulator of sigma subunit)
VLSFTAARIDLDQRTITYSGAGRLPVILLRRSSGSVERLVSQNASIGIRQDILTHQPEDIRSLAAGDRLVFYTDGLAETTNGEGRQLGQSGVGQFATNALSTDLFDVADKILGQAALFRYGPPKDDVILIVAEMK